MRIFPPFSDVDMSIVKIKKGTLKGEITPPQSKSIAHRAIICAALADCIAPEIRDYSQDIIATEKGIDAIISGLSTVDCGDSASTLRFLIPLAAALGRNVSFNISPSLKKRLNGEYGRLLSLHGAKCEYSGELTVSVSGKLTSGSFELDGDISSQYVSGLLLALPLLDGDSEIILKTKLESKPYADLTIEVMRDFGVEINKTDYGYFVKGNQHYIPCDYKIEGDWSQAAFFLAGGALCGDVTLKGLNLNSSQGDKEIINILRRFGADITLGDDSVRVKKSALKGISVNVSDIPDLAPVIAVLGTQAGGETVITGGKRLRLKESDRISSLAENLKKAGVNVTQTPDGIIIYPSKIKSAELMGFNDHRIVMAMSILSLISDGEMTVTSAESINKSYPSFFEDFCALGGKADVICNR